MVFSIATANAGVQVLCSHDDGFGHVISYESHEKGLHASCAFQHSHDESATSDHSHDDADCEDVELVDSELEDLSSSSDRAKGKSPTIQLVASVFSGCQIEMSLKVASRPPVYRVLKENESRRFAKIVQIRC
jgi:hypothetical protein